MRKGLLREGKGLAVMRFFVWLLVLLILMSLGYFFIIHKDYSDKITDPSISLRPYVEGDITPAPTFAPSVAPVVTETPAPDATLPPYATPTPSPTAEPTPSPTPEPTAVAQYLFAQFRPVDYRDIPAISQNVSAGITKCFVSPADSYGVMQIEGWAYDDVPGYDASTATCGLVVSRDSTNQHVLYLTTSRAGTSGVEHTSANVQNVEASDFRVYIDASSYADDVYSLGIILNYQIDGNGQMVSYKFDSQYTFKVVGGEIISPVPVATPAN